MNLYLADIFQEIIDRLNDRTLAKEQFIRVIHKLVLYVLLYSERLWHCLRLQLPSRDFSNFLFVHPHPKVADGLLKS